MRCCPNTVYGAWLKGLGGSHRRPHLCPSRECGTRAERHVVLSQHSAGHGQNTVSGVLFQHMWGVGRGACGPVLDHVNTGVSEHVSWTHGEHTHPVAQASPLLLLHTQCCMFPLLTSGWSSDNALKHRLTRGSRWTSPWIQWQNAPFDQGVMVQSGHCTRGGAGGH